MELGIRVTYGKLVPGRERVAMDAFAEVITYFGKKIADEKVTHFEPFFLRTGDLDRELGFMIFKGPEAEIDKILLDQEWLDLVSKGTFVVEHLAIDFLTVGDGVGEQIARANTVMDTLKV